LLFLADFAAPEKQGQYRRRRAGGGGQTKDTKGTECRNESMSGLYQSQKAKGKKLQNQYTTFTLRHWCFSEVTGVF